MLLGAVNLTPLQVSQLFQTIGSGGNRATLSALRSVIAEDGTVIYQSFPQAQRAVAPQAAYMTLYGMQQVVERGTAARRLGSKFGKYHLAGKTGTTNLMRDSWFVGIDGKEVTVSGWGWMITARPACTAAPALWCFTDVIWTISRRWH